MRLAVLRKFFWLEWLIACEEIMKYLLLLAFLGVLWWVWKKRDEAPLSARQSPAPENMVVCTYCGVHLPESDALVDGGKPYCNAAHRDAADSGQRG